MSDWLFWVITTAVVTTLGIIAFFIKKTIVDAEKRDAETRLQFTQTLSSLESKFSAAISDTKLDIRKVEDKLNSLIETLPMTFTLRDDFIRSMSGVEAKLNKILDRLPPVRGE
jgi:hypothetical protein